MNEEYLDELLDVVDSLKSKIEIKSFLEAILTPKELDEIPKRLQIVKMLKNGMAQRDIAQKLGVGVATVTRGSRELQKGSFKNIE